MTSIYQAIMPTPIGELVLQARDEGLVRVEFADSLRGDAQVEVDRHWSHPVLAEARQQLVAYFAGQRRDFQLPLAVPGTEFQSQVWQALRQIPYGESRSYGQLAQQLDRPKAMRAVGSANGANPVAIVVPCHRVIGANGKLTGYAGGLGRKQWLLALERTGEPPARIA